jgi:hypothetical protein
LEKGTNLLERKSSKMTKMESTLLGEAETVMAMKSRTRPRNSMDWEGQMILDGFTGAPRKQRTSKRKDTSRKQSLLFGARIRKSSQYTLQLIPWRAQYL